MKTRHLFVMRNNILPEDILREYVNNTVDMILYICEDSKLSDKDIEVIIEEYELDCLFYDSILEKLDNSGDVEKIKKHLSILKKVIPDLIWKLTKVGAKSSVNLVVNWAKKTHEFGKANPELVRNTFYALLFFALGYGGNSLKEKYNNNPVIPGTHIESTVINGNRAMVVTSDTTTTTIVQTEKDKMPEIKVEETPRTTTFVKQPSVDSKYNMKSPIRLLGNDELKIKRYHISNEMLHALADVEHFVDHIYDTANPKKKVTKQDMLNMKKDLTIGYGHKLTKEERKKWSFDKKITKDEGWKMFLADVKSHENIVNNKLAELPYNDKVNYSQGFFDGLLSLEFNCGAGNIMGSPTRKESEFWRRLKNCRVDKDKKCIDRSDIDFSLA